MTENEATYNLMSLSIHIMEMKKYAKFMQEMKQLPPAVKNRLRMIQNSCEPFHCEISKFLDMEAVDNMSTCFDDFQRLMLKHPERQDFIMLQLQQIVDKLEKI
jgi:hypothetical protein